MTNPPHGGAGPEGSPEPGAAPGAPPFGATQPYGQLPADFGPPPQVPRPPHDAPGHGAPGHGTPGYGGPRLGPARRRTRAGLFAVLAAVAVAVLVGIAVLALSTGPTVLSRTAVEQDVAAQFERREGVAVDLQCAQEMAVQDGATYACTGVTADDEPVSLQIEITDEDGAHYTWTEP